jgi:hypothetical protein
MFGSYLSFGVPPPRMHSRDRQKCGAENAHRSRANNSKKFTQLQTIHPPLFYLTPAFHGDWGMCICLLLICLSWFLIYSSRLISCVMSGACGSSNHSSFVPLFGWSPPLVLTSFIVRLFRYWPWLTGGSYSLCGPFNNVIFLHNFSLHHFSHCKVKSLQFPELTAFQFEWEEPIILDILLSFFLSSNAEGGLGSSEADAKALSIVSSTRTLPREVSCILTC